MAGFLLDSKGGEIYILPTTRGAFHFGS